MCVEKIFFVSMCLVVFYDEFWYHDVLEDVRVVGLVFLRVIEDMGL